MSSYSHYKKQNRKYIVELGRSSRCSECIRLGISYNINFLSSSSNQATINHQVEKLQEQKEEVIAKILRLRKQQKLLHQRRHKILRYSLKTLDELNTQERKESEERLQQEAERLLERSTKDPYPDYDPTLLARLAGLPADNLIQLSDFDSYALPIGYNSYATLDSMIVTQGLNSKTPLASQGN